MNNYYDINDCNTIYMSLWKNEKYSFLLKLSLLSIFSLRYQYESSNNKKVKAQIQGIKTSDDITKSYNKKVTFQFHSLKIFFEIFFGLPILELKA